MSAVSDYFCFVACGCVVTIIRWSLNPGLLLLCCIQHCLVVLKNALLFFVFENRCIPCVWQHVRTAVALHLLCTFRFMQQNEMASRCVLLLGLLVCQTLAFEFGTREEDLKEYPPAPIIQTEYGPVQGKTRFSVVVHSVLSLCAAGFIAPNGVAVYKNVPFAAPPEGLLCFLCSCLCCVCVCVFAFLFGWLTACVCLRPQSFEIAAAAQGLDARAQADHALALLHVPAVEILRDAVYGLWRLVRVGVFCCVSFLFLFLILCVCFLSDCVVV